MKDRGFTLIEVVVSILLFSIVIGSVFYFFSNSMQNQIKLREKYRLLRISRESIDFFINNSSVEKYGRREKEDYIIEWEIYPAEEKRKMMYMGGGASFVQLKLVHLRVKKKGDKESEFDYNFLINGLSLSKR